MVEQLAIVSSATEDSSIPGDVDDRTRGPDLCTSCGLCCMGALHNAAVLDEDEIPAARALGLPVLDRTKPGFGLPCPRLAGTVCTIYGNRPRVCGRYRCQLLQRLEAGDVSFEGACANVQTAKALIESLSTVMPPGMTLPQARAMVLEPGSPEVSNASESERRSAMRFRLAVTAATLYIDQHFRNDKEGKLLTLDPIESDGEMESDERPIV